MNNYRFSVTDSFFKKTFTGEQKGNTIQEVYQEIAEWYSFELDTEEKYLEITVELIGRGNESE